MATWLGEIPCPDCDHWQIPMAYCLKCGHKWQFVVVPNDRDVLGNLEARITALEERPSVVNVSNYSVP